MAKSLDEWLHEGQELYDAAVDDYRKLEIEAEEIQQKLGSKRTEVNQIAKVIGKPAVDDSRGAVGAAGGPSVDVIDANAPNSAPYTRNTIARALTGQPLRR